MASLSTGGVFRARARSGVALIVALLAVAHPLPAAAEDSGYEHYRYYLTATARQSLENLCIGDRVLIDVTADRILSNKRATDTDHVTNPPVQVFGVALKATAGSPDVGSLFPSNQRTSARATPPGSARFSFAPIKPGFTTLLFEGTESRSWFAGGDVKYLSRELTATVKNCEYDVRVVSHWSGFNIDYTAITDVARLRYSGVPGHFSGSAAVNWVISGSNPRPGCPGHAFGATSEVDVTAELEGTDHLIVDVDFGSVTGTFYTYSNCSDISSSQIFTNTPAPLTFTVPASGGWKDLPQTLLDNNFAVLNRSGEGAVSVQPAPQ